MAGAMPQDCVRQKGDDTCPFHVGQKVFLECEDCHGTLVCKICTTSTHKKHGFRDIEDTVQKRILEIQDFIQDVETKNISDIEQKLEDTNKKKNAVENHYLNEIKEVEYQADRLQKEIEKITKDLVDHLRSLMKTKLDMLSRYSLKLELLQYDLGVKMDEYKQILSSNNQTLLFDTHTPKEETDIPPNPTGGSMSIFRPCTEFQEYIQKAFGDIAEKVVEIVVIAEEEKPTQSLEVATNTPKIVSIPVKDTHKKKTPTNILLDKAIVLCSFKPTFEVNFICPTANNRAWVGSNKDNVVHLINNMGSIQETLTLEVRVQNVCVHPVTWVLYFCSGEDKSVRFVDTQNKCSKVLFVADAIPLSIACIHNNMLVGMMGSKVMVYTTSGKVIHTFKGPIVPWQVSVSRQMEMIAIASDWNGIIVLNNKLRKLYHFKGLESGSGQHRRELCSEASVLDERYLIVGDRYSKEVLILSAGTRQHIYTIPADGIVHAIGVQEGVIWLVCSIPSKIMCIRYTT